MPPDLPRPLAPGPVVRIYLSISGRSLLLGTPLRTDWYPKSASADGYASRAAKRRPTDGFVFSRGLAIRPRCEIWEAS